MRQRGGAEDNMNHHRFLICLLLLVSMSSCGSDNSVSQAAGGLGGATNNGGSAGLSSTTDAGSTNSPTTIGGSGAAAGASSEGLPRSSAYAGKLAINEVCPSNKTGPMDESGAYPDWIELYNASPDDIDIAGFYLTDSSDELTKSPFASGLIVKAKGVLLLWSDGDAAEQGALHTTFSLAAGGERVLLLDPDQKLIDSVEWVGAAADTAFSRFPDGTGAFAWCPKGSPNRTNGSACAQ